MSPPQNARMSLHARRAPAHASRPTKPPVLTSKRSLTAVPSKKSPTTKTGLGWSKSPSKREVVADLEEDDMTGLPQYCTTCEKQIVTPRNAMLYCSESCRKKDHNKPLHESILPPELSPLPSRRTSMYLSDDLASPTYSPTTIRPPSLAFSDSSDSSFHDPASPYTRNESEVAHYLSQFQPSPSSIEYGAPSMNYDRTRLSVSHNGEPSLSHTPSSLVSTSGSYRPLPRRGDPFSASFSSFSVDLITPVINLESPPHYRSSSVGSMDSTNTAFHISDSDFAYRKKPFMSGDLTSSGSLKQLFSHDAMKAAPWETTRPHDRRASDEAIDPMDSTWS